MNRLVQIAEITGEFNLDRQNRIDSFRVKVSLAGLENPIFEMRGANY